MSLPDPARLTTLTLDCYGTLIDWERGAIDALRLYGPTWNSAVGRRNSHGVPGLRRHALRDALPAYKAVLAGLVEEFGRRFSFPVGEDDARILVSSLPSWRPFPDAVEALRTLAQRYKLAVISNIDDDLFASTVQQLGVKFEAIVTAEQARRYKPSPAIFEQALRRLSVDPRHVAHVAEGVTEIAPARRLGCTTIWVRRHGRSGRRLIERPDLEVPDLRSLLVHLDAD